MVTSSDTILIVNGDSWTYGCEIVDPVLLEKHPNINHLTEIDHFPENDSYRLPRIWPTLLGKLLDTDVINLSEPGDDNSSILSRTQEYVLHLLNQGINPKQIFIVVGWTSPERRNFWYKSSDNMHSFKVKLNPHDTNNSHQPNSHQPIRELLKTYALNFWNPEEYIGRYVTTIMNFQNFCLSLGISFLNFNSFYRQKHIDIDQWIDVNIEEQINSFMMKGMYISNNNNRIPYKFDYRNIWKNINSIKFYNKDKTNNSFKSYIDEKCGSEGYIGWHPNEDGHTVWANELHRYIQKHNILDNR
jgi:hypothetical protein